MASLSPAVGSEQAGSRPVVIISGNAMNHNLGLCIVCPLSSKIKNYPGSVTIGQGRKTGLKIDSELQVFQIRTISQKRLGKTLGRIDEETLGQIKTELSNILTY